MIIDTININPLLKTVKKFELFRHNLETEQKQAVAIQAFEYSFELSWKMMKRLLAVHGKIANSPREIYRMAALEGFIKDPELCFDFLKKRNMTVHTYEEKEALEVISVFPDFARELQNFIKNIGA
ncbi:MAG TPA: HI0074 family nucleotidyltransferase substrate-binding subunit [Candidatus Babeliales bacterium]|nr:HI0074 family nucleotidyltransferase substrate-binding subunit [Candidatus Babeliales bacterium]